MANGVSNDITVMKLTGRGRSDTRTDIDVRGMAMIIDEPPQRGGDNAGPTPPETLLGALIGCTSRISHKIAADAGFEIRDMAIAVEAAFDRRGVKLEQEIEVPFSRVALTIDVDTDGGDAAIDRLRSDLRRFCPIAKILRAAGTDVTEVWTLRRP